VADFLDEDELQELQDKGLQAKAEYDTFASGQSAAAHAQAAQEADARHGGAGVNLFPEEALRPVVTSIGVRLLQKMGWRQACFMAPLSTACPFHHA
jgi:galactokinase